jgi:hypothetical protein
VAWLLYLASAHKLLVYCSTTSFVLATEALRYQAKMKTGELAQAGTLYLLERNEKGIFSRSITWGTVMLEYKAIFLPK